MKVWDQAGYEVTVIFFRIFMVVFFFFSATFCSSLEEYKQCLDTSLDNILPAYEVGARTVLIKLFSNLYDDMCSIGKVHGIYSSVYLSVCQFVHSSIRLSLFHPSIHLSVCLQEK